MMTAVIDEHFRKQLLTEPERVTPDFELTDDERQALVSIRAGSLPEFAAQLHEWLEQRDPYLFAARQVNESHPLPG